MRAFWCGVIWLCHVAAAQAVEQITLFCYQQQSPYVVDFDDEKGLYFDLTQRLNELLPAYHFSIRDIPRRRLDRQLAAGELHGLVLGVNPGWFGISPTYTYSQPFIEDANVLVSRNSGEVSRVTLDTLAGHRLGLVAGHQFPELDAWLLTGKVSREDSVSESVNLQRLQRGWIDATVVGTRTLGFYLRTEPSMRDHVFAAEPALYTYRRHFLVPTAYTRVLPELNRAIDALSADPVWQAKLAAYQ